MSLKSGHCIDLLHESCTYPPCSCNCHQNADESRADRDAERETDLRMDDL